MARRRLDETLAMTDGERLTLLDLVSAVDELAENDAEVNATIRLLFESGHVRFDELSIDTLPWAA